MNVGDTVTLEDIHLSDVKGWVVITNLIPDRFGAAGGGGTIAYIEPTVSRAGNRVTQLRKKGITDSMIIMGGGLGGLCVGGIFVQ